MPAPNTPLSGDQLLAAVTDAMVALHRRYHHRAPVTAKTLLLEGELLVCVLGGVYTDVEKTMIELQRATVVQSAPTWRSRYLCSSRRRLGPSSHRLHELTALVEPDIGLGSPPA